MQGPQQSEKVDRPKTMISEAILQATEANPAKSIWKISNSASPVWLITFTTRGAELCLMLPKYYENFWLIWVAFHVTKILQNFSLTRVALHVTKILQNFWATRVALHVTKILQNFSLTRVILLVTKNFWLTLVMPHVTKIL